MSDKEKDSGAAGALVKAVLAGDKKSNPPHAMDDGRDAELDDEVSDSGAHPESDSATKLIGLFFTLDEPLERDACFDEIAALKAPVVVEFMRAAMQSDGDDYIRAAAAAELTRRGEPEGRSALEADIADPENLDLFSNALQTLAEIDGEAFYPRLLTLWRSDELDAELALEVLAVMEQIAPGRALEDFIHAIAAIDSPLKFRDDQFEAMAMAFVRQGYAPAVEHLLALKSRASNFSMDLDDRRELVEFIDEGIALLQTSHNSAGRLG